MARYRRRRYYPRRYVRVYSRGRGRGSSTKWITFAGGVAAGVFAPKLIPMQDELALVVTAAPVKMPRAVRSIASGYVIGRILKNKTGIGGSTGGTSNTNWY